MSTNVTSVMLKALYSNAEKYKTTIDQVQILLALNERGNLDCTVIAGATTVRNVPLAALIGMYAMVAAGKLKRILIGLETEMNVVRGVVDVVISSPDNINISIVARKSGVPEKQLLVNQLL